MSTVEKRCACGEHRWTKCPDPWYLKTIEHGGRYYSPNLTRHARVVLDRTITAKGEAEDVGELVRRAIRNNVYVSAKDYRPPTPAPAPIVLTLDAIAATYTTARITNNVTRPKKTKGNDKAILTRLCAHPSERGRLGARAMGTITVDDLVAFRAAQGFANSTWNKYWTQLKRLWQWAHYNGHLTTDMLTTAPLDIRKLLGRGKCAQRSQRVSPEVLADILEAAHETRNPEIGNRLWAIIIAAIETACRVGELLALQWADVHLDRGVLEIRAIEVGGKKTGTPRTIELSAVMRQLLPTLQKDPAGFTLKPTAYVFGDAYGGRVKSIYKSWCTALLRAHKIEPTWDRHGYFDATSKQAIKDLKIHFHDLRHEAGNLLLESGCFTLVEIQHRYGHTTLTTTARYLHANAGSMTAAQATYDAQRRTAGTIPVLTRHKAGPNGPRRLSAVRQKLA